MSSYTHKPLKNKISNNSNGKCGEITFCIQVDKRVYALNCLYCSQICLQWDMFINHMEQMHDAELNSEYPLHTENDESELNVNDYTADFASTLEVQLKTPNNAQLNSTATSHLDDPLEEEYYLNPSSMPVKVEHFDYTPNELMMDDQGDTTTNSQDDKELSDQDYEIDGDDNFTDNDDLTSKSSNSNNDNDINEKVTYDKRQLNELLIKYYKDHPVLWNTNKKEHKNDMKHNDAYKNITKMINKDMNLKLKCIQIKGKINKLKSKFRNEQQLIIDFQESKEKVDPTDDEDNDMESAVEEQKPISWLYQKMSFLKDHINLERKRSKRVSKVSKNKNMHMKLQNENEDLSINLPDSPIIKNDNKRNCNSDIAEEISINLSNAPIIKTEIEDAANTDENLLYIDSNKPENDITEEISINLSIGKKEPEIKNDLNRLEEDPNNFAMDIVKVEPFIIQPDQIAQKNNNTKRNKNQKSIHNLDSRNPNDAYAMQQELTVQKRPYHAKKEIQKNRNQGKAYINSSGKIVTGRKCIPLKACRKNCKDKISYKDQQILFNNYWNLKSYNQRIAFMASQIKIVEKASQTLNKSTTNPKNRQNTVIYFMEINGIKINVCKSCFICTFGETEGFIKTVQTKKLSCNPNMLRDNRGKQSPHKKLIPDNTELIKKHLLSFPAVEVNNYKYLSSKLSIRKMHRLYCEEHEAVSLSKYVKTFCNLSYKFNYKNTLPLNES